MHKRKKAYDFFSKMSPNLLIRPKIDFNYWPWTSSTVRFRWTWSYTRKLRGATSSLEGLGQRAIGSWAFNQSTALVSSSPPAPPLCRSRVYWRAFEAPEAPHTNRNAYVVVQWRRSVCLFTRIPLQSARRSRLRTTFNITTTTSEPPLCKHLFCNVVVVVVAVAAAQSSTRTRHVALLCVDVAGSDGRTAS